MNTFLGIELGSTRIKAILMDEQYTPIASGGFDWENRFEDGIWTYHLDDVWRGMQGSLASLLADYQGKYQGADFPNVSGMGISAMMHGYLPLDKDDKQLAAFRTWRNTITEDAAARLTELFAFNIPQRWSIAHLYQTMLNGEPHVKDIAYLTTLAGYVHYKLTGEKVLGINDASAMLPADSATMDYDTKMVSSFDAIAAEHGLPWRILDILPKALCAGEPAGMLTEAGAQLLDPTGTLKAGIPLCPPEGDAGTGMVATNSVAPRTGNVSAGTSIFAMFVLEEPLSKLYPEIDIFATPAGKPTAMVHCNNCTSDLDAWVNLFGEAMTQMGTPPDKQSLYRSLYEAALRGDADGGGLVSCNYLSGEHITGFHQGRPLFIRTQDSAFTLSNFMRNLLYSAMASLRIGMDILTEQEGMRFSKLIGHGGLFKTPLVGQTLMAGALNVPLALMESAGEGGAWGIALLAAYAVQKKSGETLEDFLSNRVFSDTHVTCVEPDPMDVQGFALYRERYKAMLDVERTAVERIENRGQ